MQIEIFPVKMQVVCISINTSYVSILSLHKTWDSLNSSVFGYAFSCFFLSIIFIKRVLKNYFLSFIRTRFYARATDYRYYDLSIKKDYLQHTLQGSDFGQLLSGPE